MLARNEMTSTEFQSAALAVRAPLGAFYVVHALLVGAVFSAESGALHIASLEALGGLLLAAGVCTRTVAVALMPVGGAAYLLGFGGFAPLVIGLAGMAMLFLSPSAIDFNE